MTTVVFGIQGQAVANTSAYELYCPGSPVGTVVFNDVITTGSLSSSSPKQGKSFSINNYQTTVPVPEPIVQATQALGDTKLTGNIQVTVDVSDATPTGRNEKATYSTPIPSSVTGPLPVSAPSSAVVVGPFKATGSTIVVSVATSVTMATAVTAGSPPLKMECLTYPNGTLKSGITTKKPKGSPVAPIIAKSG